MKRAYLVLENGLFFEGERFGADTDGIGELVFSTGVGGYIETLTDPGSLGQIIVQTFPLIGNYGIIEEDFEGKCMLGGYVVRQWCDTPSNFRSQYSIDRFLKENGVPGICGVDTRSITRIIQKNGSMNAVITDTIPTDLNAVRQFSIKSPVLLATCREKAFYPAEDSRYNVAIIDYGLKKSLIRELNRRGCSVTVFPAAVSAEEITECAPDGIILSSGPGVPEENTYQIEQIKKLLGRFPIMGICLGHLLLALAAGSKTFKLLHGHHGENQPCRRTSDGRIFATAQSHGYCVDADSISLGRQSYVNVNDLTCEGIEYPEARAFSVQFHPEGCAGPRDTEFIFEQFISLMGGKSNA